MEDQGPWYVFDGVADRAFTDPLAARRFYERLGDMSVVREWADLNRALLDQAQEIIDATARPRRLGQANNIPAIIDATMPGEEVGDSGLVKERALAINAMWESFSEWLITPLEAAGGITPLQVLSQRD